LSVAWLTETLVRVAIVVVSGWAVGANSSDSYVLGLADTLLSSVAEEFIQTLAGYYAASLSVLVVGLPSQAL
jgi:pantothenate kinase-related protein Tda10